MDGVEVREDREKKTMNFVNNLRQALRSSLKESETIRGQFCLSLSY